MKNERRTRDTENRMFDKDESRTFYNHDYINPLTVPEHVRKPGFEYYYERRSLKGQMDTALTMAYRRGWRPVKISDDPNRIPSDLFELDEVARTYICEGDCILLEREIAIGEIERKKHNEYSLRMATESKAYNFNDSKPTENALNVKI